MAISIIIGLQRATPFSAGAIQCTCWARLFLSLIRLACSSADLLRLKLRFLTPSPSISCQTIFLRQLISRLHFKACWLFALETWKISRGEPTMKSSRSTPCQWCGTCKLLWPKIAWPNSWCAVHCMILLEMFWADIGSKKVCTMQISLLWVAFLLMTFQKALLKGSACSCIFLCTFFPSVALAIPFSNDPSFMLSLSVSDPSSSACKRDKLSMASCLAAKLAWRRVIIPCREILP